MIHKSQITNIPDMLEYWRKPTKEEIKFGHGAFHYRDFNFDYCFDSEGFMKLKVESNDDKLIYYSTVIEYTIAKKVPMHKI